MTLPLTDTFTTGTNQTLQAYNANWKINAGAFSVIAASDVVYPNASNAESGAHRQDEAFNNDQYAQLTLKALNLPLGVSVRAAADTTNSYYGYYADGSASYLFKVINGTWTQVGSDGGGFAANDVIRLEISGTTLTPKKNGSTADIGAQTVAGLTSGYAGLSGYGATSSSTGDDWEGGNLSSATNITPAEATQPQTSDAANLKAIYPIAPAEATQSQISDAAGISLAVGITPAEATQSQTSDAATLTPIYVIASAEATQAQTSDTASIKAIYVIAGAESTQAQTSDAAGVTFSGAGAIDITAAEASQYQLSDAASLTALYPIMVAECTQTQTSDAAVINFTPPTWNISPAETSQAQISDPVTLSAIYILAAGEGLQAQTSDLAILLLGNPGVGTRTARQLQMRSNIAVNVRSAYILDMRRNAEVDDGD